eukprot:SAG22_NODE_1681_length_3818_cov_1.844313_2_plen_109_part_00
MFRSFLWAASIVTKMVALMERGHTDVNRQLLLPALRTLGNFVTGDDMQTQQAVNAGVVNGLCAVLRESTESRERKEALWSLSNITAGNRQQIQAVLDSDAVGFAVAGR